MRMYCMSVVLDSNVADAESKRNYDAEFETSVPDKDFDPEDEIGPAKMCLASWVVIPIPV